MVHKNASLAKRLFGGLFSIYSYTLFAIIFIAGCATNGPPTSQNNATHSTLNLDHPTPLQKQGRLSIKVASEPPQSLTAAFEIKGSSTQGELRLMSPIGSTIALLSWTPTQAFLMANNESKEFQHIDTLMQELTGTVLPLNAVFDWLVAIPTPAPGWQLDLSQMKHPERPSLYAKRTAPQPAAELRVVLEP